MLAWVAAGVTGEGCAQQLATLRAELTRTRAQLDATDAELRATRHQLAACHATAPHASRTAGAPAPGAPGSPRASLSSPDELAWPLASPRGLERPSLPSSAVVLAFSDPPARRTMECVNSASPGADSRGRGCAFYERRPQACGNFDSQNFTAGAVCCACGGGSREPCGDGLVSSRCYGHLCEELVAGGRTYGELRQAHGCLCGCEPAGPSPGSPKESWGGSAADFCCCGTENSCAHETRVALQVG